MVEGLEGTTVVVTSDPATDGVVLVDVDGKGYYVNLTDGSAELLIKDLEPGNHTATVTFLGNDLYEGASVTKNFTTSEGLKLEVNSTGNETVVEVTVPGNATNGTIIIRINGTDYVGEVSNGTASVNLTNITPGIYDATIIYVDGNGTKSEINTTIAVPKWDASVNATAKDIIEGFDEVISIKVTPDKVTGIALVDINNIGYYVNLTDGAATLTIKDLKEGKYTAKVTYMGDDCYNNATTTVSFTVSKAIEVNVGNDSVVEVVVPNNATNGTVTIIIDGQNYTANVTDGKAVINLTNVTPGVHDATVIYVDGNGTESEFNTTIAVPKWTSEISATVDNSTAGKATVSVDVPDDATGYVIVSVDGRDYAINLTDGQKSVDIPILTSGEYEAVVTYIGDDKYLPSSVNGTFHAEGINQTSDVTVEVKDTPAGEDVEVKVTVPEGSTGNVTVTIGNVTQTSPVSGGDNIINVPGVDEGTYNVTVKYTDDQTNTTKTIVKTITVFNSINAEKELTRGWGSPYDYKAEFLDNEGHVLVDTDVQFIINGQTYTVKTDSQGMAYLTTKLDVGTYDIEIINPVTGARANATTTIVKRLIENKDLTMDFVDGTYYVVRAIGDDGKPVGAGEIVRISTNTVNYARETDENGYARLKIELNPATYTITAQYRAFKVSNKLVVRQTLKLVKSTVKVKKSAKKLVIKAKLQWHNGKAISGKKLTLKFKGKTYKAKTNSKGIAKFTIKKKVIKKLKAGKKYKYSVTYISNIVKGKVKVKK
jgi:cell division protein ZapA (FtsZ GTPase activity inhibitor)